MLDGELGVPKGLQRHEVAGQRSVHGTITPKPGEPGTKEWKQAGSPRISATAADPNFPDRKGPEGPGVPVGTDLSKNYYPESAGMYKGDAQPANPAQPMYPPGHSQNDAAGFPKSTASGEALPTNTSLPKTVGKNPALTDKYFPSGNDSNYAPGTSY